jgi:hypothetical protein
MPNIINHKGLLEYGSGYVLIQESAEALVALLSEQSISIYLAEVE